MTEHRGAGLSADEPRRDALLDAQRLVLEMMVRGRSLPEILTSLCQIVEQQAEGATAQIFLLEEGRRLHSAAAPSLPVAFLQALDGIEIAADLGTCCAAAARAEAVVTPDLASSPGWRSLRDLPLALGLRAAWSMPIMSAHGNVLGTFGTYFQEPRAPSAHERQLVEVLAPTAALAIERYRSQELMRDSLARSQFLSELAAATQPLLEASEVMATTARLLAEHLGVQRCAYAEVESEQLFVITGDYTLGVPSIVGRWLVAAFGPRCVADMLAGRAYVVEDVERDPDIGQEHLAAYRATTIRAVVCVPLHKEGRFSAAMAVHATEPRRWTRSEVELVSLVVARCWEALERARVTRTLRESEARNRAMVEASPECVMLVAADGTLLQMNPAGLRIVELDERSALGRSVYDFVAPEHRARFRAFNEEVCQGRGGTLEYEMVSASGSRRTVDSTAVPLAARSGGYDQLSVTRDVTARVAVARALAQSRARLDYAVRLSGVGFWYCDLPFDELIWDERVKEHFFLPRDARVTIDTFYERIHPEDREATRHAIDVSIRERVSYDVVYRTTDPNSSAFKWVRALGGTAYAEDGTPTRFDGVTVDVTEQKRDQERLARGLERERAQTRLLQKVAEAAVTIHATSSVDSVLRVVGEEARRIVGATNVVASLAEPPEPVAPLPPGPERDEHDGSLSVVLTGRKGVRLGTVRLGGKRDGEFSETDEAILTQLAQIGAVALQNARLYDQLREQDRRKDEFLATLAHELRNPLAPIRTGLQVLRLDAGAAHAAKTREMMERQLGHLVRMVDDLLDVSRITLGKVTLKREPVDLRSAVQSALETTRQLIEGARHELRIELPPHPVILNADPTRLVQIVSNLLNNAAKYTPEGGRIGVRAEVQEAWVTVTVEDTGIGIAPDMLPRVFELFMQAGPALTHAQGGLGIGLTLVRRLVEMHDGTIAAESAGEGRGSAFTLRLPLLRRDGDAGATAPGLSATVRGKLRVLVVDDNVDGAETLAMLLDLLGHEARMAHDGHEAIAQVQAFLPELVILDIGLPGLSGYQVAERLRADAQGPQPVLVALTGWGSEEDRRRALAAGFDRHLVKPFDTTKLEQLLLEVTGKR